jgi:hypothetical protein
MMSLLITLAFVGFIAWLIITYVPMSAGVKQLVTIVAIILCVWILINAFGLMAYDPPVPRLR